jgi:hypothetical protein
MILLCYLSFAYFYGSLISHDILRADVLTQDTENTHKDMWLDQKRHSHLQKPQKYKSKSFLSLSKIKTAELFLSL